MRTLTRWEPFRGTTSLQDQVNRLFSDIFERKGEESSLTAWAPSVDIYETEHELVVKADLRERRELSSCGARLRLLRPKFHSCEYRELRSNQGRLPERCPHAKHSKARGSQAQADQGQRRDSCDGGICFRQVTLAEPCSAAVN